MRIRRDAFADGVPSRDLVLSPDHAILVDGVLIAARLPVNGATIAQDRHRRRIRYHHVELDAHGVILAKGLPVESHLGTGNRGMFENADAPWILHPDFAAGQPERIVGSCRPFVDDAARVEPIWRGLAARAERLGYRFPPAAATTDDPGLHVVLGTSAGGSVTGRAIRPVRAAAGRYTFVLPRPDAPARLASRAVRPCERQPWLEDRRRLGVMVSRLTLWRGAEPAPIPLDHPSLSDGWWSVERDRAALWHWTDGNAVLGLSGEGPAVLEVVTAGGLDYPIGHGFDAEPARAAPARMHSAAA